MTGKHKRGNEDHVVVPAEVARTKLIFKVVDFSVQHGTLAQQAGEEEIVSMVSPFSPHPHLPPWCLPHIPKPSGYTGMRPPVERRWPLSTGVRRGQCKSV